MSEISVITPPANQFGFCEGVVAAHEFLESVSRIASSHGVDRVFGYHDIVHNADVRRIHEENGVVFVDDHREIPVGSIAVLSAHGSSPVVGFEIEANGGLALDATCPLVIHTHNAVRDARAQDSKVLYLLQGKPDNVEKIHDEVVGTIGHMDWYISEGSKLVREEVSRSYIELSDDPSDIVDLLDKNGRYTIVSQTTLDNLAVLAFRDELVRSIRTYQPSAEINRLNAKDVCRAVRQRQEGVRVLLQKKPDELIVVTDRASKNGMGYVHLAQQVVRDEALATRVSMVERASDVPDGKFVGKIALTASASTPDEVSMEVVLALGASEEQARDLIPGKGERPTFRLQNPRPSDLERVISEWVTVRG